MKNNPAELRAARKLFADFTGREPSACDTMTLPDHRVLLVVGTLELIGYRAVRDGKSDLYVHEFEPKSRPVLAASHDGFQLYLLAGAYRFTDRGIEDR